MSLTNQLFEEIIREYSNSEKTIKEILKSRDLERHTFYKFLSDEPAARVRFDQVKEFKAEDNIDEIVSIADNEKLDHLRARTMIEVRKWTASKLLSKKYGDRLDINLSKTIDISQALVEASERVISLQSLNNTVKLPPRDLSLGSSTECVEITHTSMNRSTGQEPVEPSNTPISEISPDQNDDEDIFS